MKNDNDVEIVSGAVLWTYFPLRQVMIADIAISTDYDGTVWVRLDNDQLNSTSPNDLFNTREDAIVAARLVLDRELEKQIGVLEGLLTFHKERHKKAIDCIETAATWSESRGE